MKIHNNMEIIFSPDKLEEKYTNANWLKKKFNKEISIGMIKFLGALSSAENAHDIKCMPQFYMEHKKGNLKEYYAVSLDKKKSKWRLMLQMLNDNYEVVIPTENEKLFLQSIKKILVKELSDHYDEY